MTERVMKFRGRKYTFERKIPTQLSVDYVPDWTLFHAIRETLQNAYDERIMSGAKVTMFLDRPNDLVAILDRGRGVAFEDILLLGVSGKRGVENVVGQHGEGEVVSSMVAARVGIVKQMASQDWMVIGRIADEGAHRILVLDLYRTKKPRIGTCWTYQDRPGYGQALYEVLKEARKAFRAHTLRGGRILMGEDDEGQLFTQGMEVNKLNDLALGYNLRMTPGRDRAGFTWVQCRNEIEELLGQEGKAKHFATILKKAFAWYRVAELDLDPRVDPKVAKQAARMATKSAKKHNVVWSTFGQSSYVADAREQGMFVLEFGGRKVPDWIHGNFASVIQATDGSIGGRAYRDLPNSLQNVLDALRVIFKDTIPECKIVTMDDKSVRAVARENEIVFNRSYVKNEICDLKRLIATLAHEIAHIKSGAADCTRSHADTMARVMASVIENLAISSEARDAYVQAKCWLLRYQG